MKKEFRVTRVSNPCMELPNEELRPFGFSHSKKHRRYASVTYAGTSRLLAIRVFRLSSRSPRASPNASWSWAILNTRFAATRRGAIFCRDTGKALLFESRRNTGFCTFKDRE